MRASEVVLKLGFQIFDSVLASMRELVGVWFFSSSDDCFLLELSGQEALPIEPEEKPACRLHRYFEVLGDVLRRGQAEIVDGFKDVQLVQCSASVQYSLSSPPSKARKALTASSRFGISFSRRSSTPPVRPLTIDRVVVLI